MTLEPSRTTPRARLGQEATVERQYSVRPCDTFLSEYFALALNLVFGWVVRMGQEESDSGLAVVPLARLWEIVDEALDKQQFSVDRQLGGHGVAGSMLAPTFADLLAANVTLSPGVDATWPRHATLDEHALYEWCDNAVDDGETLIAMLAILLTIHRRLGTPARVAELLADQQILAEGGSLRVGMARFFTLLNRRLLAGNTLSKLARWVIKDFVIVQHERVATAKLPDDTFRVRRVGDHVKFSMHDAPAAFNDSRFVALSTTAHELGLVSSLRAPQRKLTTDGNLLLHEGDLPGGALDKAALSFKPRPDESA